MKTLEQGTIVRHLGSYYRVKSSVRDLVNLCSVYSGTTLKKGIPREDVVEDTKGYYDSFLKKSKISVG